MSSMAGSIGLLEDNQFKLASYGASKAAANYLVRKINFEHDDIVTLAVHPGYGDLLNVCLGGTNSGLFV